jgi:integrase
MKLRFILFRRSGTFYCEDTDTGKQLSLRTKNEAEAQTLLNAKNEAVRQPALNLQLARTYLTAAEPMVQKWTWKDALDTLVSIKSGSKQDRWIRAGRDKALAGLMGRPLLETQAENLIVALNVGTVSTNVHLRKLHNFCVAMNFLPWPILPKAQWPAVRFGEKRAITVAEHEKIIGIEWDAERKAFYELLWHLGGAQSDIACLKADAIDWRQQTVVYARQKTNTISFFHFGPELGRILETLPKKGLLFPRIAGMHEKHRAAEFKRRCKRLKIAGVTLHSYRYAWAERAKVAGYPERFAQEALGHNSKAVHRAYARHAQMRLPSLEEFERKQPPQQGGLIADAKAAS